MDSEPPPSVPALPGNLPVNSPAGISPEAVASIAPAGSPIADLSYRNYDGPLRIHAVRWWIISAAVLRKGLRSPVFWIGVGLCLLSYLAQGFSLYFQMRIKQMSGAFGNPGPEVNFALSFFSALTGPMNAFGLLVIALRIGAGSIAADNRTNALLVYLSKPITKSDYLLGKWVGLFLTMLMVTLGPTLLFYLYCALSYSGEGFFAGDKLLLGRALLAAVIPPLIHASLMIGLSAWSKSPSMAGAFYAGLYLLGGLVVGVLGGLMTLNGPDASTRGQLVQHLSIGGAINGLIQNVYQISVPNNFRSQKAHELVSTAPPALWAMLLLAGILVVVGIGAARFRIQAVEVVRG